MQKIINFFREVRAEFKHITWPSKETIIQSTIVVISISIVVSLILGGFDYLFTRAIALFEAPSKPQTVITPAPESTDNFVLPTGKLQPTIKK